MKRLFSFALLFSSLLTLSVSAQENVIKTGITNALFGDFNLSYERVIKEKQSLNFKIGYLNPMTSFILTEKVITPNQYTFQDSKGGFHVSMEYRFYLTNDNALKGLYLAPFVRHFNQRVLYTDVIDGDQFDVDMKGLNFGIGAQLGYQLIVNDAFTLDFYFMGLSLDHYSGTLNYTLSQPRSGFNYSSITDNIDDSFEDYRFLSKNLTHHVKADRDEVKVPFFFPGIRIGISAGIAF